MKGVIEVLGLGLLLLALVWLSGAIGNPKLAAAMQILQGTQTTQQTGVQSAQSDGANSVMGQPSLSAAFIDQVLAAAHSPASGLGYVFYSNSVKYNINDVYALAFYQHESSLGTAGEAVDSLSIGNLRCVYKGYEDLHPWCPDGYTHWPSWQAGIEAWYRLIRNVYVNQWGLSTIPQIIPHYAPTADHNNEAAYIAAVEQSVTTWKQESAA